LVVSLSAAVAATVVNVVSFWCLARAYHIHLALLDAAAVFAIIMIGTFLPNTPSNLGSWQFFCVVGYSWSAFLPLAQPVLASWHL